MKALIPIEITSYTTTNILENDYAEYAGGTTYALDARVIVASEHNVYQSLQNANTGNTPSTSPMWWVLVGKTNAYKAIDNKVSTQTVNAGNITFTFPTLKATAIAFLNVKCSSLTVRVLDGATEIYSSTIKGVTHNPTGWYTYFFNDFEYKNFFLFEHVFNPNATYEITLTGTDCALGVMVRGRTFLVGDTLVDLGVGYNDYSAMVEDAFGETYLQEGNYRNYFNAPIAIENNKINLVKKMMIDRRGKLTLFVPTGAEQESVYGFPRTPEFMYTEFDKSVCNFNIQGVI